MLVEIIEKLANMGVESNHKIENYIRILDNRHYKPNVKDDDDDDDEGFMESRPAT